MVSTNHERLLSSSHYAYHRCDEEHYKEVARNILSHNAVRRGRASEHANAISIADPLTFGFASLISER